MGERPPPGQENVFEEAFKGDTLSARMQQIQLKKRDDDARKQQEKVKYEKRMEEERAKEREALKRRMAAEKDSRELREKRDKQQPDLLSEMRKVKEQNKTTNQTAGGLSIKDSPNLPINSKSEIARLDLVVDKKDTPDAENNDPEFAETKQDEGVGRDDAFKPTVLLKRQSKGTQTLVNLKFRVFYYYYSPTDC